MTVIILALCALPAYPFSDQSTAERMLKENKYFIDFLNLCVTNFGAERAGDAKEKFFEIYQLHFNAQVFFLQSDYKNSFRNIRSSQNKGAALYLDILRNVYLEDTKNLLDKLAPDIIKSKNPRARLYLTLAYRDRSISKNFETIGDASNPKLYSYKIFKYIDGLKFSRRAKRYGLLALYESRKDDLKRDIFIHLLEMERESGSKFFNRFLKKSGKTYIDEMDKSYEAHEKEEAAAPKKDEPAKDAKGAPAGTAAKQPGEADKDDTFEKRLEKKVRFRKERSTAQHILQNEFDRAEDIMREYVDDFNFKLIQATLEVLSARKGDGKGEAPAAGDINYAALIKQHYDNYMRTRKDQKTLMDEFASRLKVVDDIDKKGEEPKKDAAQPPKDETKKSDDKKTR